jgi:hypothetical protein
LFSDPWKPCRERSRWFWKPWKQYRQRCRCERGVEPEKRWPGYDFNTYEELCRCCTIEPLRSGSCWSPFFCRECRERVMELNRRFGRCVIPIGRHSIMNEFSLRGGEALVAEHAEHFANQLRRLFGSTAHLEVYTSARTRESLAVLGFPPGQDVEVDQYLKRARAAGLKKEAAFAELRDHFGAGAAPAAGDRIGLQRLRRSDGLPPTGNGGS